MVAVICNITFTHSVVGYHSMWNRFRWQYLDHIYGSDNAFVWLYACYHRVLPYFEVNGNKEKKTSQKISTGDGFASSEGHFSSRRQFSNLAAPNNTCQPVRVSYAILSLFQNNYFNIFFCAGVSDIYTIHNSLNLSQDSSEIPRMLLHL